MYPGLPDRDTVSGGLPPDVLNEEEWINLVAKNCVIVLMGVSVEAILDTDEDNGLCIWILPKVILALTLLISCPCVSNWYVTLRTTLEHILDVELKTGRGGATLPSSNPHRQIEDSGRSDSTPDPGPDFAATNLLESFVQKYCISISANVDGSFWVCPRAPFLSTAAGTGHGGLDICFDIKKLDALRVDDAVHRDSVSSVVQLESKFSRKRKAAFWEHKPLKTSLGRLRIPRLAPRYWLSLLLAAVLMVVPTLYVLTVGLDGWAFVWYENLTIQKDVIYNTGIQLRWGEVRCHSLEYHFFI